MKTIIKLTLALLLLTASSARASEAPAPVEESDKWGVNIDLGFSTLYIFRGLNLFQGGSNRDPHLALMPSGTWSVFDTGLSITLFGAYQLNGNVQENIDVGLGAEQDLIISYTHALPADLTITGTFVWYLYPFADEEQAGGTLPSYLEPIVDLVWGGPVDAGLQLAYNAGVQEALADFRYLYIAPKVARSFEFAGGDGSVDLAFSVGFKLFTQGELTRDNSYDMLLSAAVAVPVGNSGYLKPSFNLGWTNLADLGVDEEIIFWFGLSAGYDL
jgi:hypothetical protein